MRKAIKHEMSSHMIEADFESTKALHESSGVLVPKPFSWGEAKLADHHGFCY